jgi:hypothetical protein
MKDACSAMYVKKNHCVSASAFHSIPFFTGLMAICHFTATFNRSLEYGMSTASPLGNDESVDTEANRQSCAVRIYWSEIGATYTIRSYER